MSDMKAETNLHMYTVCDNCCELLMHKIVLNPTNIEVRVEACPDCGSKEAREIIRSLLDCPDLNLDSLEEETIRRKEKANEWLRENHYS